MYKYETHLHTAPVSKCAKCGVRENLEFYKKLGYDGVFITNHFLDGNVSVDRSLPYNEQIEFYFSDYEEGVRLSKEIGIKVFFGVEISNRGTDFLVYGLDKEWFLSHPEIMQMKKSEELKLFMDSGALVIQAHPFREAGYIDHIRLFPRCVHGVEILNASMNDFVNEMAKHYADSYSLIHFAGSDNHVAGNRSYYAGMETEMPIESEADFVRKVLNGEMRIFDYKTE
jgi:hypothetical protein